MRRLARLVADAMIASLLLAGGCGWSRLQTLPPAPRGQEVRVRPAVNAFHLQTLSHRWLVTDIVQYAVTLKRWNGTTYADLNPSVCETLPQKGTIRSTALFQNLRRGDRYLFSVTAWGNAGGTAATTMLNATPATASVDFTSGQDVTSSIVLAVPLTLDPVPYSGTAVVVPGNPPSGTSTYQIALKNDATGVTLYTASYAKTQTMTLRNLKTGVSYRVWLTAKKSNGSTLKTATSSVLYADPLGKDLEQAVTCSVAF